MSVVLKLVIFEVDFVYYPKLSISYSLIVFKGNFTYKV